MISAHLLREARLRAGLSQAELGRRTGKAASAIGRWERGEVEPSLETLRRLIRSAGFEVSVALVPADDHDLALIRRCLAKTPAQRLDELALAVNRLAVMASGPRD